MIPREFDFKSFVLGLCYGKDETCTKSEIHSYVVGKLNTLSQTINAALQGKSDVGHTHTKANITDFAHNHTKNQITDLTKVNTTTDGLMSKELYNQLKDVTKHPSTHASSMIIEASALGNIGTSENANQHDINDAINTIIGNLSNLDAIEIVETKPTASASTMGKLYIMPENDALKIYYTKSTTSGSTTTYSWEEINAGLFNDLSITWNDVTGKPSFGTGASDFAVGNHTHGALNNNGTMATANRFVVTDNSKNISLKEKLGQITLDGKIGNTNGLPVITGTGGEITTGSFGSTNGTFAEGNHNHDGTYIKNTSGTVSSTNILNGTIVNEDISANASIDFSKINKTIDTTATSGSSNLITSGAVYTGLNGKSDSSHGHGYIDNNGILKIEGTAQASKNVVTNSSGKITVADKYTHPSTHPSSIIIESSAFAIGNSNGTPANATQHDINCAIVDEINLKAAYSHTHSQYVPKTDFRNIEILCVKPNTNTSYYNVDIDSDVQVIVNVKDFTNTNVSNHSVTLKVDKGYFKSYGSTTINNTTTKTVTMNTDSNGQIKAVYNASEWGLSTFSVGNSHVQVYVDGWKQVWERNSSTDEKYARAYTNGEEVFVDIHWSSWQPTNGGEFNSSDNAIPSEYCPYTATKQIGIASNRHNYIRLKEDGIITAHYDGTLDSNDANNWYAHFHYPLKSKFV